MYVTKMVGVMFFLITILDILATLNISGTIIALLLTTLVISILLILLIISRQPQNR